MHNNNIVFLQVVQTWGTEEVVAWLEREGLDVLSSMARDQGFGGGMDSPGPLLGNKEGTQFLQV